MDDILNPVTKETHKKILDNLDNSIYQIKGTEGKYGTGFFCYVKCHNKNIPILITSYQIIDENYVEKNKNLDIYINEERIEIEFGSIYYMDKDLDLTLIEIKENNKIKFLELDDNIYNKESELFNLYKESIYIIHSDNANNICVSYRIINNIKNSKLISYCNIDTISNTCPIFNLKINQINWLKSKEFHL